MTNSFEQINKSLIKRNRSEKTFKFFGLLGIIFAISFLVVILSSIFIEGKKAFISTYIQVEVFFDSKIIDPDNNKKDSEIKFANFKKVISDSLLKNFPEVTGRKDKMKLTSFISSSEVDNLMSLVLNDKTLINQSKKLWLLASSTIDVI